MGPDILLPIIMFCTLAWLVNNWIRAKYGYDLDDGAGNKVGKADQAGAQRLLETNQALTDRLENAEDRIAVLERIITDEGYDTARKIEALRDRREQA